MHGDFQKLYYVHHLGGDPAARDRHAASPYFDDCAAFCERWDQSSFDPAHDTLPLQTFAPLVHEVFARTPYDPAVTRPGVREPLVRPDVANERAA